MTRVSTTAALLFTWVLASPAAEAASKRPSRRKAAPERRVPAMRGNLPNVQATGAVVMDVDTGREIFNRNSDQVRPIASISKLAAALVIADRNLELEDLTTITQEDAKVAEGGAPSRLLVGMTLSNRDLLHAALLGSDNRAVPALGRATGLSPAELTAAMNRKAQEMGLRHTRFRDPTGLSPENVSTAREVMVMLQTTMRDPLLGPVVRRLEYDAHPVNRPAIKYVNTHRPAHRSNVEVLGGKTGFNDEARYCLVLAGKIDGRMYCMSFLGTEGKLTRFGDVARVADWIVSRRPMGGPPAKAAPPEPVVTSAPSGPSGLPSGTPDAAAAAAPTLPASGAVAVPTPEPRGAGPI